MRNIFLPAVSLVVLSLSGCTAEPTSSTPAEGLAKQSENTNNTTVEAYVSPLPDDAPVYIVAMTGTTPPFSLKNDYGLLAGIDVDVMRAVGELEGFKVDFIQAINWTDMFDLADTGKADLAMSGISYREERDKKYALSDTYFFNPIAVAHTDTTLKLTKLQDLKGKKIGGIVNSTSIEFAKKVINAEVIEQETPFLAYSALIKGDIDATMYDYPVLKFYAQQMPEYKVIITPIEEEDEVNNKGAFAVVMASKDNATLIEKVNKGLKTLKENGEIDAIEKKWLEGK